jgi:cytoskeleton protein RodZ
MPSAAQARGFFRSYAEFLGLDADELIDRQRIEPAPPAGPENPDVLAPDAEIVDTPEAQVLPAPIAEPEPEAPQAEAETVEPVDVPLREEIRPPVISQLIFVEIGREIRQRRELLSLTLDEIERHTRVRKHYLEKIEAGNYEELPSPVQARGMLSNYASFLNMDSDALLLRFADALQARRIERQPATPVKSTMPRPQIVLPPWLGRFVSPDLLFGGGMILLLFILTLWGAVRIFSNGSASASATQGPSISDVLLAPSVTTSAATEAVLPTSVAVANPTDEVALVIGATDTPQPAELSSSNVQITLSVLERTFIRVTVDGEIKQDGRVAPGAALTFQGNEHIEILTGSGSAIQVFFNQQDLGIMGNFGEVVDRIYTLNGVQTPTPTFSPTVTETPRFQKTPSATPTITSTVEK